MRFVAFAVPVAILASTLISGCSSSSGSSTLLRTVDTVSSGTASTYLNGTLFAPAQTYVEASEYISVSSATDALTFTLSSAPSGTFAPVEEPIGSGSLYTAIIFGRADITNPTDIRYPRMSVVQDDRTSPGSGNSRVRVVHAAPDGVAYDVTINGTNEATNVGYTSVSGYNDISAGAEVISVENTGTTTPVVTGTFSFNAGQLYTIFIVESVATGSPAYNIYVTNDSVTSSTSTITTPVTAAVKPI